MKISNKQLLGLHVETVSGQTLGKVCGWELEIDTHQIVRYEIKTSGFISHPFSKELLVSPSQVVSIGLDKMVVEDNVSKSLAVSKEEKSQPIKDPRPVSMSKN